MKYKASEKGDTIVALRAEGMLSDDREDKTPVVIVTGFLGSGKTTLVNRILTEQHLMKRYAVIENEFGEVNIDSDLLSQQARINTAEFLSMDNGCICCTIREDLVQALADLS